MSNFKCQISNLRSPADDCKQATSNKRQATSKKILVAMSGGVDSSVAAALLKKQGYNVIGVFLKFWSPPSATQTYADRESIADLRRQNICCNQEALMSARSVADKLKIPFYVLDVSKEFKREVVDYYINEYDSGRTPNPCVVCNKKIKFGWLLDKAKELGCEYIATGHYVRLGRETRNPNIEIRNKSKIQNHNVQNRCHFDSNEIRWRNPFCLRDSSTIAQNNTIMRLFRANDQKKDQTYFLWQLDQNQLKHILFPIGDYLKSEVREMAKKWGLSVYDRKESQNVCFIPNENNAGFLKKYARKLTKSGKIVDKYGNILGKHQGLYKYTVGQRKGLGIANSILPIAYRKNNKRLAISPKPKYVLKLNIQKNELVVGVEKDLYSKELVAEKVNWIDSHIAYRISQGEEIRLKVKIRYGHQAENCQIAKLPNCHKKKTENNLAIKAIFDKPQRAITPGQSVVFYSKNGELIGGGIIK